MKRQTLAAGLLAGLLCAAPLKASEPIEEPAMPPAAPLTAQAAPLATPAQSLLALPAQAPGLAAAGAPRPLARAQAVLHKVRDWLWPAVSSPYGYDLNRHYYHGTSFETLFQIAAGDGAMASSYFSNEPGHPKGYARARSRHTGTPGVVLQFPREALAENLFESTYQPLPMARTSREIEAFLPHFYQTHDPVPLSAMTERSKQAILEWLSVQ
ncbi:MAG: hypothetical protein KGK30_06295, partial [Elusimicrobia bacterium]|nr:hypothetical protein [Elusimicrobiota bacterium]